MKLANHLEEFEKIKYIKMVTINKTEFLKKYGEEFDLYYKEKMYPKIEDYNLIVRIEMYLNKVWKGKGLLLFTLIAALLSCAIFSFLYNYSIILWALTAGGIMIFVFVYFPVTKKRWKKDKSIAKKNLNNIREHFSVRTEVIKLFCEENGIELI